MQSMISFNRQFSCLTALLAITYNLCLQCLSVVLSVVQTSRNSIALSLHTLAALPQLQEKLRSEIETYLQKHVSYLSVVKYIFMYTVKKCLAFKIYLLLHMWNTIRNKSKYLRTNEVEKQYCVHDFHIKHFYSISE